MILLLSPYPRLYVLFVLYHTLAHVATCLRRSTAHKNHEFDYLMKYIPSDDFVAVAVSTALSSISITPHACACG